ncbi:CPCC family cysteine-rich protein [Herbaspirillum huttiense]|uniref:CPCC family cysteine-rich protein n=1 Tax=Herbaspirillum huttiense subsp. lycopersici TaxID=3074428 RepID=A0ABU2ER62_9BURK|nr:CPCC family cysteine-rich protein [Herbaspirillum huttiense]MDR9850649.1 CPCC family cysteine-rich protein [Herbaspirillum huttiense SE1]
MNDFGQNESPDIMFTCPCCGHEVFSEPPGSHEICSVCFWEDDELQLYYPYASGANSCSLMEAQVNFVQFGACDRAMVKTARKLMEGDTRDAGWFPLRERPVDLPGIDGIERKSVTSLGGLYCWIRQSWPDSN